MNKKQIWMTTYDKERLNSLIEVTKATGTKKKDYIFQLENELEWANIVEPQDIPRDVVTMNSAVLVRDLESSEEIQCTLTFPSDALFEKRRISILSALGTAMIGYRVGDTIEWKVPSGLKRWKIEEILYQPEASGHFDR